MSPSERIDQLIAELTDWRGKTFASIRKSILEADREIIEEWKWMGSPVWSRDGMITAHLLAMMAHAHRAISPRHSIRLSCRMESACSRIELGTVNAGISTIG